VVGVDRRPVLGGPRLEVHHADVLEVGPSGLLVDGAGIPERVFVCSCVCVLCLFVSERKERASVVNRCSRACEKGVSVVNEW
jgi:hypothetical protein